MSLELSSLMRALDGMPPATPSGDPRDPRRYTPRGELKTPKFVKFHPGDSAVGLDEVFWEDPNDYQRYRCPVSGRIIYWGTVPICEDGYEADVDVFQCLNRTMEIQMLYRHDLERPETQFVKAVMEQKKAELTKRDLGDLTRRDYTLHISVEHMPETKKIERRIRVSGGLSLPIFSDKIMKPLFGLVRNLHAHIFMDFSDGSQFGPRDSNAIDMMHHITRTGYAFLPDDEYVLAHFLQRPGDELGYLYDFGDQWHLLIKVESIAPLDESTGKVVVLSGTGHHPPDGHSSWQYIDLLAAADKSPADRAAALGALFGSTGYRGVPRDPHFDFARFSVDETARAVRAALASPLSVVGAAKVFTVPFVPGYEHRSSTWHPSPLKKGQKLVRTPLRGEDGAPMCTYMEEGVSQRRRDNPATAACASCGNPHDLKACARCKLLYYCSKECQKDHWNEGHKIECKAGKAK